MNIFGTCRIGCFRWIRATVVAMLFVCSVALAGDEKDKKKDTTPHPAPPRSAPQSSAPASRPAPPPASQPAAPAMRHEGPAVRHEDPAIANRPNPAPVNRPVPPQINRPAPPPASQPAAPAVRHEGPAVRYEGPAIANRPTTAPVNRPVPSPVGHPGQAGPSSAAQIARRPDGGVQTYHGPNNTVAHFHRDGGVAIVRTPGRTIYHSSAGTRRVVLERPGGTVIVAHGTGNGYIQRPFVFGGRTYVHRTYVVNNATFVHVYRPYRYGGVTLHVYAPFRYYSPAFYEYAYMPWRMPVYYNWGWSGRPWFTYYGGYFEPYPVYTYPSLWLTDYVMAEILQEAYLERRAAEAEASAYARSSQAAITPDVKQAIADEVRRQLVLERADSQEEAQNSMAGQGSDNLPPTISGNGPHVFVAFHSLDATDVMAGGQECAITEGDVLQLDGAPPASADAVNVRVLASKGRNDCRKGSLVAMPLQELVEMQNHMRETMDQGLEQLQSRQGQGGLPALPVSARSAPVQASFAAAMPPADQSVAAEVNQQMQDAAQTEQRVAAEAQSAITSGAPPTISLGQTIDEVVAILGAPARIVDLGTKRIYIYKDMKITFSDGKLSDVQ